MQRITRRGFWGSLSALFAGRRALFAGAAANRTTFSKHFERGILVIEPAVLKQSFSEAARFVIPR